MDTFLIKEVNKDYSFVGGKLLRKLNINIMVMKINLIRQNVHRIFTNCTGTFCRNFNHLPFYWYFKNIRSLKVLRASPNYAILLQKSLYFQD